MVICMKTKLNLMTWKEAESYFAANDTVLFPVGCVHAHDHIAMGIDNESATYISEKVAERTGVITLPCLNFGWMAHYTDYPGTLNVQSETLKDLVLQVVTQLRKWGARKVIFVNGHGGNTGYLEEVALEAREMGMFTPILEWYKLARTVTASIDAEAMAEEAEVSGHLRGTETAFAIGIDESLVNRDEIFFIESNNVVGEAFELNWFLGLKYRGAVISMPMKVWEVSREGEKARGPSVDTSRRMVEGVIDFMCEFTDDFKRVCVPDSPGQSSKD